LSSHGHGDTVRMLDGRQHWNWINVHIPLIKMVLLATAAPAAAAPGATPIDTEQVMVAPVGGAVLLADQIEATETEIPGEVTAAPGAPAEPAASAGDVPQEAPQGDVIYVVGVQAATPGDPLEQINATTFQLSQSVDRAFVAPVADIYQEVLPGPLRSGLRNFLRNLLEPVNFINGMLQLKPGLAFEALGRFALNSTLGLGGLLDVAKREPFGMEFRRNGFSNTLGYYGVDDGAFLVLPLVGATTVRDLIGSTLDQAIVPFAVGAPLNTLYYGIPAYTVNSLEFRVEFDDRYTQISSSDDPYAAMRASYLCEREADIAELHGDAPPRDCSIDALMAAIEAEAAARFEAEDAAAEAASSQP